METMEQILFRSGFHVLMDNRSKGIDKFPCFDLSNVFFWFQKLQKRHDAHMNLVHSYAYKAEEINEMIQKKHGKNNCSFETPSIGVLIKF